MASANSRIRAGRIGGLTLHATHDSFEIAARARAGLDQKFRREVVAAAAANGQDDLTEAEIERRVLLSRRIYFTRISAKRACVRRLEAA